MLLTLPVLLGLGMLFTLIALIVCLLPNWSYGFGLWWEPSTLFAISLLALLGLLALA